MAKKRTPKEYGRGWLFRRRRKPRVDRFERFAPDARQAFVHAHEEARLFNHNYIGTEHLLLGLVRDANGAAGRALASLGVELDKVRSSVEFIIGRGVGEVVGDPSLTPRAKKVIELSMDEARRLKSREIGSEHLLLGLVREGEGIAAGVLESLGVGLEAVRTQMMTALLRPGEPLPPLPSLPPPRRGVSVNVTRGVANPPRADELVYGLTLPPDMFTKLAGVAQRLNRPVDDLMREAIARTWLAEPPADTVSPTAEPPSLRA